MSNAYPSSIASCRRAFDSITEIVRSATAKSLLCRLFARLGGFGYIHGSAIVHQQRGSRLGYRYLVGDLLAQPLVRSRSAHDVPVDHNRVLLCPNYGNY